MGRHTRPDTETVPETVTDAATEADPRPLAMAVRHTIPAWVTSSSPFDATTTSLRAVDPTPPVAAAGPPARLSRRDRRAARHEQEARAALAARLSRAERRNRQVATFTVPGPRTPDPSVSGPLAVARPPWSPGS